MSAAMVGLTLAAVAASSVAHVLMKLAARQGGTALAVWLNPRSLAAYALFASAVLASAFAMRQLEYGVIVALTALAYPLVALFSAWILKEPTTATRIRAQALVCSGVLIYCLPL